MRVLVEVGCELDPTLNVRVQGGQVFCEAGDKLSRVKPLGRRGIDLATGIAAAEIISFALGPANEEALLHSLAAGARRAVQLMGEGLEERQGRTALAAWLLAQKPQLVIGERAVAVAAATLGWAFLSGVERLDWRGEKLQVVRSLGRGDRERLETTLPAVVCLGEGRPRYLARARLLEADRENRIETETLINSPEAKTLEKGDLQPARLRTRVAEKTVPVSGGAQKRLQALMKGESARESNKPRSPAAEVEPPTLEAQAETFLRYLAHHGFLGSLMSGSKRTPGSEKEKATTPLPGQDGISMR
jgi:electron transfer flavoprotein alpha/beta subunit